MGKLLRNTSWLLAVPLVMLCLAIIDNGSANAQADNFVVNGTFDIPVPEGGAAGSWTSTSNCIGAGGTFNFGGNNIFVMNECGQAGSDPSIVQTLSGLTPGVTYQVSGDFANYYGCCGSPAALSFGVAIDGIVILELPNPGPALLQGGSLVGFSATFVATNSTHSLSFTAERNGDDTEYAIDNIEVTGANAQTVIPVQNPSFEDFDLGFAGNFTSNGVGLTGFGWTVTGGTKVGVFRPGSIFFNEPIPDGVNTAYSANATISQVLNEVLTPNTTYTLEVEIGNQNNEELGGYRVQLLAGGTLLAEDNNTLFPANGTFATSIVTFNALPGDPNLGLPLEIRLVPLGGSTGFKNTNFDNVRLLAGPRTCIQPPAGLVSWWPGDGDATDIQDANDGTLQNGATFAPGFVTSGTGQAFSFDGVDDFVSIDHNNNLNVASHTIEAWIKTPAFPPSTFATILSKTTPAPFERTFGLFIEPSFVPFPLTPGALLGDFTNGPNNFNSSRGNTVVTDGKFHHVAVTYDAPSGTMRLYVDGNLDVETMFAPGTLPDTHTLPASIGAELSGIGSNARLSFNGLIDELELYNRALSAAEIQAIFNAGSAGKCKPVCTPPPSGLVSWWDGDSVSGSTAVDIADGNDGTLENGATTAGGKVGDAFSFVVGDFVSVADSPNLNISGVPDGLTVDAWFNLSSVPADFPSIITKGPTNTQYLLFVNAVAGAASGTSPVCFRINTGPDNPPSRNDIVFNTVCSTSKVVYGQFMHVAGVFEPAAGVLDGSSIKIYVNGVQEASVPVRGTDPRVVTDTSLLATTASAPGALIIGAGNGFLFDNGDVIDNKAQGLIDEVEIYDRALNASEIQGIFQAGSAGKCNVAPNQPPLAQCQDVTVSADFRCQANANVDKSSFDPDGDEITLDQDPPGPYSLGATNVTLTVTDDQGESDSCSTTVTVVDEESPAITCPDPQVVECTSPSGAVASFSQTFSDNCRVTVGSCVPPSGSSFTLGSTPVSCTATDESGNSSSCESSLEVVDTIPPAVACVESVNPSGKNVPRARKVNEDGFYRVSASDVCSSEPTITLGGIPLANGETIKITQRPRVSGVRWVNTMGPAQIKHFLVGPGDAVITATDPSGNTASVICLVPPPPK